MRKHVAVVMVIFLVSMAVPLTSTNEEKSIGSLQYFILPKIQ
ncbi:hypothetical protein ADU37_CDS02010 [Thermococcus sp. 2319x1]|nr:hypothetical protein [Thermococcus sp. 2319x1]ALV61900.1 hypothetical protein ADU37_CDS02010 [Thermococcus sp. 2319x1]